MSDAEQPAETWSAEPRRALLILATLPAVAAIGPLLTVFRGFFAFRVMCVVIIIHAALFMMGRERWRPTDLWLVATSVSFGAAGMLGLVVIAPGSQDPYAEFLSIGLGLATALAVRAWQRHVPGIYFALARGWIVAGLMTCGVALLEILTGRHLPGYVLSASPDPASTFGNPNAFAIFLVMANVWAIPVRRSSGLLWQVATWVLVALSGPVLYATGARLAMLTWILVVAWSLWLRIRHSRSGLASIGAALLPIVAALMVVVGAPVLFGYGTEISTFGSSGSVREELTVLGLGFAAERWGLPAGPGAFEALMLEHGGHLTDAGLVNAHNTWVELLVQYGALSLLLLIGWLIACAAARSGARSEAALAVVTLLVLGVVDSSSLDDASLWMFVITLAAASRTRPEPILAPAPARAPEALTR